MNKDLIEWLGCPMDGFHPLQLQAKVYSGERIEEGELRCPSCESRFDIIAGIPSFLALNPTQLSEVQRREMEIRDRGYRRAEMYEPETERLPELDALRHAIGDCSGLQALDAGCGIGQMTRVLYTAARVIGLDFAWQGLNKFHVPNPFRIDLLLADVCRMPFRKNLFDVSISCQVLEHMPSQALRAAFLAQLARALKPGGRLVITTYNWDWGRREMGISKEGLHANGIFYYCYDAEEFRSELGKYFKVEAIWGVQVLLPKTFRLVKALGRYNLYWDRFWRTKDISLTYSKLLLAICRTCC